MVARLSGPDQTNFAPSLLQQFKDFISHPPVIKNLVFAKKIPMNGGMLPLDGSFAFSTAFVCFQAKWQTNGMLYRQIGSATGASNFDFAGRLVSVSDHKHAVAEPSRQSTTWDDRDPSVAGKSIFWIAGGQGATGIELSKGATPILLLLVILLPQSNLESKSKVRFVKSVCIRG